MVGKSKQKPLKIASSTPYYKRDGVVVELPFAALVKYDVNVRVFHPNKNFEKLGFRFHGDNRGFSAGESWFGDSAKDLPTSRIWQRYVLDANLESIGNIGTKEETELKTESNFSDSGPGLWSLLAWGKEEYKKPEFKPRGTLETLQAEAPHGGQKIVRLRSHLAGENHAFITSETQQRISGHTVVPTLDAFHDLMIRVERVQLYMDIVSISYGDGFPNCESFIKDPAGNQLFLGSHVRIGYPSTHLWGEQKRLIWANALRVEIDADGNFGDKLWVFAQVLGGPPDLRDEYPTSAEAEVCLASANKPRLDLAATGNFHVPLRGKFTWNCGEAKQITQTKSGSTEPLYLSAFSNPLQVKDLVNETFKIGPKRKLTRTEWNDYHLHRDPNAGRAKDDPEYQIDETKWQAKK